MSVQVEAGERAKRRQELLALGAGVTTVVLWASAFVGIRAAGEDLSGGALSLGRLAVASLVLGVIVLARREPLIPRRDVPALLVCGLLWFAIYNVALNEAERRVDAGTAAMLVNVGPILIALLAGWLLHEGFPRTLLTGCAIAFGGVVVIGLATSQEGLTASWGTALCLLAALTYAGGVIAQKPLLERSSRAERHVARVLRRAPWRACRSRRRWSRARPRRRLRDGLDGLPRRAAHRASRSPPGRTRSPAARPGAWARSRTSCRRSRSSSGWALLDEVPPVLALAGGVAVPRRRGDGAPPLSRRRRS